MNDDKILFGQVYERKDRNGNTYFIGKFGMMGTVTVFKHRTKQGVWNMFLSKDTRPEREESSDLPDRNPPAEFDYDGDLPF